MGYTFLSLFGFPHAGCGILGGLCTVFHRCVTKMSLLIGIVMHTSTDTENCGVLDTECLPWTELNKLEVWYEARNWNETCAVFKKNPKASK